MRTVSNSKLQEIAGIDSLPAISHDAWLKNRSEQSLEKEFAIWLYAQEKSDGDPYAENYLKQIVSALKNTCK